MPASLDQLLEVKTQAQNLEQALADYESQGVTAVGFHPLSTQRADPELLARAVTVEQGYRTELVKAALLRPEDLPTLDPALVDVVVFGMYQTTRNRATKARHLFTIQQTTSAGPYTIKIGTRAQSTGGVEFEATEEKVLPAGPGSIQVEFRAVNVGTTGNIPPGDVYKLVQSLPGANISNPPGSLLVAAIDDETNDQYVARAQSKLGTLGAGGHEDAIRYLISTAVPSITRIGIDDSNPFGPGTVGIWLANASGPATLQEISEASAAVKRPLGSGVFYYFAAAPVNVHVAAALTTDGTNPSAAVQAAANLQKLATNFPGDGKLGGTLAQSLVIGVLQGGAFASYGIGAISGIKSVAITTPAGNTTLSASEVLTISTAITQV